MKAKYAYSADGVKLSVSDGTSSFGYEYLGSLIYVRTNGSLSLDRALFDGGTVRPNGAVDYFVKDHLGSVRVIVDQAGTVREQNYYYPYGERCPESTYAVSSVNRYKFNGKEEQTVGDLGMLDYGARMYQAGIGRWFVPDPLAEKYYSISPYAYCGNNPIRLIDPTGMDVYRFDDKTGTMNLFKKTKDDYDQIGKFKHDKFTGEYKLKTNKQGEVRTRIDNIEKGILKDGMNFKTSANVINVGGVGQASVAGFESFIIKFSDMIRKELAGFYYSKNGQAEIDYIHIGKYENNTSIKSYPTPNIFSVRPDLLGKIKPHTSWHTHPSNASDSDRLHSSEQDKDFKKDAKQLGVNRFIILTGGYPPIEY